MGAAELDLTPLVDLSALVRQWEAAHLRGLQHLETIPVMYSNATGESPFPEVPSGIERTIDATRSLRLVAFLKAGWQHPSAAAEAPQKLTDAIGRIAEVVAEARDILGKAQKTLGELQSAVSGGTSCTAGSDVDVRTVDQVAEKGVWGFGHAHESHWMDHVPNEVLKTRVPWGIDRSVEDWVWLATAVVEGLAQEVAVMDRVTEYVAGGRLRRDKLGGCIEAWKLQPYVEDTLLHALVNRAADA